MISIGVPCCNVGESKSGSLTPTCAEKMVEAGSVVEFCTELWEGERRGGGGRE